MSAKKKAGIAIGIIVGIIVWIAAANLLMRWWATAGSVIVGLIAGVIVGGIVGVMIGDEVDAGDRESAIARQVHDYYRKNRR